MKIEWTPALSVGDEKIDAQHQRLIESIAELEESIKTMTEMAGIRKILSVLAKYVQEHFSTEEAYMGRIGFPNLPQHKKVHEEFVNYYNELRQEIQATQISSATISTLAQKVHKFLGEWFINHIVGMDQKIAEFVREKIK